MDNTKLILSKDGNKWCVLWGENLQEGIAGFGDTIEKAMVNFAIDVIEFKSKEFGLYHEARDTSIPIDNWY